MNTHRRLTRQK